MVRLLVEAVNMEAPMAMIQVEEALATAADVCRMAEVLMKSTEAPMSLEVVQEQTMSER